MLNEKTSENLKCFESSKHQITHYSVEHDVKHFYWVE